jgi:hypothetical protein
MHIRYKNAQRNVQKIIFLFPALVRGTLETKNRRTHY